MKSFTEGREEDVEASKGGQQGVELTGSILASQHDSKHRMLLSPFKLLQIYKIRHTKLDQSTMNSAANSFEDQSCKH
jgi:hypothetical protein